MTPLVLLCFVFMNLLDCTGSYNMQQGKADIGPRHSSIIKCVIDNINDNDLESNCGVCIIWDRTNDNFLYMSKNNELLQCPGPAKKGKVLLKMQ